MSPIMNAPMASETPSSSATPAVRTASPTKHHDDDLLVLGVDEAADPAGPVPSHQREREEETERRRDVDDCRRRSLGVAEHRLQQREVQGEEHVLDDDDAEDDALSRLPSRRRSTSSLVTIADDEMPTTPATTRASRIPHPNESPRSSPPPTLSTR
jgi:hypothetical protein